MDLQERLANCKRGRHEKEVIAKIDSGPVASDFVRWCKVCGAIVIENMDGSTIVEPWRKPEILSLIESG